MAMAVVGGVLGLVALLVLAAFVYDRASTWWAGRNLDRFAIGDDFTLREGRRALIADIELRWRADHLVAGSGWDPRPFALADLPAVVGSGNQRRYQLERIDAGPPPRLRVLPWHGLQLSAAHRAISWSEQLVRDPQPGGRPWARVEVACEFAFEVAKLGRRPQVALTDHIVFEVRFPSGAVTSHTVRSLERARFFLNTGLAPSWADPESSHPAEEGNGELAGMLDVDLGPVLKRPQAPIEIVVFASFGPYRSNELRLELGP